MRYRPILILDNKERAFLQDLLMNINDKIYNSQEIPNKEITEITEQLIDKHKINFAEFMYQLKNEETIEFWRNNGFDELYNNKLLETLKNVLLITYNKLIGRKWR